MISMQKNLVWSCIAHSNSLGSIRPLCTLIGFYHDGVWKSETAWDSLSSLLMVFIQTLTLDSPVLLRWQDLPFSCWVQISSTSSWIAWTPSAKALDYDYPTKAHSGDAQQLLHLQNATPPPQPLHRSSRTACTHSTHVHTQDPVLCLPRIAALLTWA